MALTVPSARNALPADLSLARLLQDSTRLHLLWEAHVGRPVSACPSPPPRTSYPAPLSPALHSLPPHTQIIYPFIVLVACFPHEDEDLSLFYSPMHPKHPEWKHLYAGIFASGFSFVTWGR